MNKTIISSCLSLKTSCFKSQPLPPVPGSSFVSLNIYLQIPFLSHYYPLIHVCVTYNMGWRNSLPKHPHQQSPPSTQLLHENFDIVTLRSKIVSGSSGWQIYTWSRLHCSLYITISVHLFMLFPEPTMLFPSFENVPVLQCLSQILHSLWGFP